MKKGVALCLCLLFGMVVAGCTGSPENTVALLLPTKQLQYWVDNGTALQREFATYGYNTDLQYAGDDVSVQLSQIENMIAKGVKAMVITPIDGPTLSGVLQRAEEAGIVVLSYDRLIANTSTLDAYITFDNFQAGVQQGKFIADAFLRSGKDHFNIELFGGDPGDNNAHFYFEGALSVLNPYLERGEMSIPSGQTDFFQCATMGWSTEAAQKRMDNLITRYYSSGEGIDGILAPNDDVAMGALTALKIQGYQKRQAYPAITGQDASVAGVLRVKAGEQAMTVFKDARMLSKRTAQACNDFLKGNPVVFDDTTTYDNGSTVVPSFLCPIQVVTKDNIQELLIDSGRYTAAQLAEAE